MRYLKPVLIAALILSLPAVMILPKRGNAGVYVLILCGLIGLACRFKPMGKGFGPLMREYWPINLAMLGLVSAIFLNHLANGHFVLKTYEKPLRLAFSPLIFWGLLLLPLKDLKILQWGLVAGTTAGAAALFIGTDMGALRPLTILNIPLIPFADFTFLLAALVLFSIGWNEASDKKVIAIKILVACAGLYAAYLAQVRGGWVAVPVFLLLGFAAMKTIPTTKKMAGIALILMVLIGTSVSSGIVKSGIAAARSDLKHYIDGDDLNTSIGIRFQLWRGSWIIFRENPVFGVGLEQFDESLHKLAARGVITPAAAIQPHSHNDLLFHMATLGMVGGGAILALYFVPAVYFVRKLHSAERETRTVATMGLMLTFGFFIFGLTDVLFYWSISHTSYSIILAALFAHLVKQSASLSEHGEKSFHPQDAGAKQSGCRISA